MNQCMTKESLKKIIKERVLTEPSAVRKYTGGKCKTPSGQFESNLRITIHQHALSQIMILIFFLDKAKMHRVLSNDPCLFETSSAMKSSEELLLSLCQDCFLKQGSIIKHLDFEGVSVSHFQTPLDEYDFHVKNLAVDLKDGVRLARMIDAITSYRSSDLLSSMRLPATTRQHKVYNVDLALSALRHLGVPHISDITTAHIVAAHQPRILQLIWSIILYFDLPQFRSEIIEYKASRLIQGYARRFLGMRSYRLACNGIILFQSICRGYQVRTRVATMNDAATLIERVWRGHRAKLMYEVQLLGIITIQRLCRKRGARRNSASTAIQRMWRGYTCKVDFICDMMDIITSQSVARRFIAKNRTSRMRQRLNIASTAIQRVWRGYHGRIRFGCDMMDIITVQSVCRRFIAIRRTKVQSTAWNNAAIDIQRVWRGYSAMTYYGFDLLDIILAQSVCRQFIARKRYMRTRACREIQSIVRGWIAKRTYSTCRRAICTIQTHCRRLIASNHARDLKTNIIVLQRVCRGWLCRKQCRMNVAQGIICSEASPTLRQFIDSAFPSSPNQVPADTGADVGGGAVMDDITSFIESHTFESSSILNCSSSSDDGEEINFTSKCAPKKPGFRVAKLVESTPTLPHAIQVNETTSLNIKQAGDNAVVSNKMALKSSSDINCSLATDDDGEEICFTSRLAPKKQHFCVAKKIVESLPLPPYVIQFDDTTPLNLKQEGDDAVSDRPALESSSNLNCSSSSSDDGEEINFTSRHAPKNQHFHVATVVESFVDESKHTADDVHIHAWLENNSIGNKGRSSASKASDSIPENYTLLNSSSVLLPSQGEALVRIQSVWRRAIASKALSQKRQAKYLTLLPLKREYASVLIQAMLRRVNASQDYLRKRKASIVCQRYLRKWAAERTVSNMRLQAEKEELHRKILHTASTIQRSQSNAAIQIQRIWRGYRANVNYILFILAAIRIQAFARRNFAATEYCHLKVRHNASVTIQSATRGLLARLDKKRVYDAVSIMQRAARVMIRRKVEYFAAKEIQRVWRGYIGNLNFIIFVISAIKIQAMFRGHQARHKVNILRANRRAEVKCFAATEIQRCWRGYRSYMEFALAVISVIKIQAAVRGRQARVVLIRHKSSRAIQRIGRGFSAKQRTRRIIAEMETQRAAARYLIIRKETEYAAATSIQRMWRGYQANVNFMLAVMSAIKIQSFTRNILTKVNDNDRRPMKESFVAAENESILRDMTNHQVVQEETGLRLEKKIDRLGEKMKSESSGKRNTLPKSVTIRMSPALCHSSSSSSVAIQSNETPKQSFESIRSPEFGRRTTNAIRTILVSKKFNEILKAAADMAEITNQSFNDSQLLMSKKIDHRLISLLRRCNRSSPHLELVHAIVSVLTNLAQHPTILTRLATEYTVDALTDVVQMFRDKTTIFSLTSSLLEKVLLVNNRLLSKYSTPENKKRLSSIIVLCQKRVSEIDEMQKAMSSLENIVRLVNSTNYAPRQRQ